MTVFFNVNFMTEILLQSYIPVLGLYHPLISQAMILSFTFALIADLFGLMGKSRATYIGDWLIVFGASLCFPAVVTGWEAAKNVDVDSPLLTFHAQTGYAVLGFGVPYALFRLAGFFGYVKIPPLIHVILTVGLVYLTSWAASFNLK